MAKTNIERFDEMSADILAFLYDNFPIHKSVSPEVTGLSVVTCGEYDPETGQSERVSGQVDPETQFFYSTLEWLAQAGFISLKPSSGGPRRYVLTAFGLQALKHVPKPTLGTETLGEKLSTATKSGARHVASEALNQALSIGVQLITKHAGF
ncbi:hypothetical protein [Pseudomonas sp. Bi130]|uniref:hypothetical protein n=1 Tax=Pseudomonas sp. Bi130 TaxID=2821122 RepID=UPI001E3E32C5|nr:hypothetical protein [Pseudomonas sp. Bi130]